MHVMAQGPLSIGGFGGGDGDNSVQVNHLTVGRVPGGGLVQVGQGIEMPSATTIRLSLREPDFITADRVAQAINQELGPDSAVATDPASVTVNVPEAYQSSLAGLMARLEPLSVEVDASARVVINERTGTVVVGSGVRIGTAAVAHGNLSVRITTRFDVSQPAPFSEVGQTVVIPEQEVEVIEDTAQLITLPEGATLDAVVQALNALGATPRDIIAIMQALKASGALRAEIIII